MTLLLTSESYHFIMSDRLAESPPERLDLHRAFVAWLSRVRSFGEFG